MRTLALEWAPHGIRVNTILAGFVATEMTRDIDNSPERLVITSRTPPGRLGTPEEIGNVASFLASDMASYITGESITVDGGWSIARPRPRNVRVTLIFAPRHLRRPWRAPRRSSGGTWRPGRAISSWP
jgi:NAD(P)-dependent dehydrogenase (short-subunit alcohol dehydrogenase family)